MRQKITKDEFIERANKVHGNKYNYDDAIINGALTKINIVCPVHGEFNQSVSNHLRGDSCAKCKIDNRRLNNDEFIKRAIEIHGDKFIYDRTNYVISSQKVIIGCKIHGYFEQTPNAHLHGSGCKKCHVESRMANVQDGMLKCATCNTLKPLSEYKKRNSSYYTRCKSCISYYSKDRSKKYKTRLCESQIRFEQLSKFERVRFNKDGFIEVRCKKHECQKWFTPTIRQVDDRIKAFNGTAHSEHNFYCSKECKDNCILYGKVSTPELKAFELGMSYEEYSLIKSDRDIQTWDFVRDKVLNLDDKTCCLCGSKRSLEVHHIIPFSINPMLAYDPDNLITLCKTCHDKNHTGECSTSNLSKRSCVKWYKKKSNGLPVEWHNELNKKQRNDLIGQRFGKLTVVEMVEDNKSVKCKCDCGNECVKNIQTIKAGDVKSCGCLALENSNRIRMSKIGESYGKLKIIEYAGQCKKGPMYKCICECGGEKITAYDYLKRNGVKSCGCISKSRTNIASR